MHLESRPHLSSSLADQESPIPLPSDEVQLLLKRHPNVLITGGPAAAAAALRQLSAWFRPPVESWLAGEALNLSPAASTKTLILTDAASMSPLDQQRFLKWLQQNEGATQVITISPVPLYVLVDRGDFSDLLYYYLNLVHFDLV